MNQILQIIIIITALTTTGCLCGFFIVLNYIKERIEREERQQYDKAKNEINPRIQN